MGFLNTTEYAVGTVLHSQPSVSLGSVGSAAHWACSCAVTMVLLGIAGLAVCAAQLPDSFLAAAVLSGAVPFSQKQQALCLLSQLIYLSSPGTQQSGLGRLHCSTG